MKATQTLALLLAALSVNIWITPASSSTQTSKAVAKSARHYVFFNRDRKRIADPAFLATKAFEGAQIKYTWPELEPEPDAYDFSAIRQDLEFLTSKGKRLFIQLQDVSFHDNIVNVPRYLQRDIRYNG